MKKMFLFLALLCAATFGFATEGGYVGMDACKDCHEDAVNAFMKTAHGIAATPGSPAATLGCESCHGPGQAHLDAGGGKGTGMKAFGKGVSVSDQNAACLGCHTGGNVALWKSGTHATKGLACTSCHSIHKGGQKFLAKPQTELCAGCHPAIRAQLNRSSHHPIREGKLQCSNCHNPHGTVADKLISANSTNDKCYECHADKRGPYLWEHPVVAENCMACHLPHGSPHDRLLNAKQPYSCQRCHSNSRHPGTLYALNEATPDVPPEQGLNNRSFYRACVNCHVAIHGSNHPSGKTFIR